jgi:diguanylate cyclase (GGDEF)-like protein
VTIEPSRVRGDRSLRATWMRAFGALLVVLLLAGGSIWVLTDRVTDEFSSAAGQVDHAAAYNAHLSGLIAMHENQAQGLIDGVPGKPARFLTGQADLIRVFEKPPADAKTSAEEHLLGRAERQWKGALLAVGYWSSAPRGAKGPTLAKHARLASGTTTATDTLTQLETLSRKLAHARLLRARRLAELVSLLVAFAFLVAVSVTIYLMRRLSKDVLWPVDRLRKSVTRLQDGDLEHRTAIEDPTRGSELSNLAVALNEMASALSASHEALNYQARHDILTNLPNRQAFEAHLRELFPSAGGRGTEDISVLFVDIDDFKHVNDSLGHAAGDQLLADIADRLREATRPGDFVARLGGDEFAVVIRTDAAKLEAGALATRVLETVAHPLRIAGSDVRVTVSVGVAYGGTESRSIEELVSHADYAMYSAKRAGKGRYNTFFHRASGVLPGPN